MCKQTSENVKMPLQKFGPWALVLETSSNLQPSGPLKADPLALGVEPVQIRMETCKENMKRNHSGVYCPLLEGEMLQAACWSQIKTYELQLDVCMPVCVCGGGACSPACVVC